MWMEVMITWLYGGLQPIVSRVVLDVIALMALIYVCLRPLELENILRLLTVYGTTLFTAGWTSRWPLTFPMVPLLFLQGLRTLFQESKWIRYASFGWIALSAVLCILFPPLDLPQPRGPHRVGVVDVFLPLSIHPSFCPPSSCTLFPTTNHVSVRIFYPTQDTHKPATAAAAAASANVQPKMPYMRPSVGLEYLEVSMKAAGPEPLKTSDWLMHHWFLTELEAHPNASLWNDKELLPLVIYSHGLMGSSELYSYQAMELASSGMVVLMVDHMDGSAPVVQQSDGSLRTFDFDLVQMWFDGKELEYTLERRNRTDWRVQEFLGATLAMKSLHEENLPILHDFGLSFVDRLDLDQVYFMGHSFGGATVLTAASRRPDLVTSVIAHEPAIDWMPDDARQSLFAQGRLEGLQESKNFTGGMGGLVYESTKKNSSIHDVVDLLLLFSHQWRSKGWAWTALLEEMHQQGRLGRNQNVSSFAVIDQAHHNEFSDMCMLTPLWLARGVGVTGKRNPLETAQEISDRTRTFIQSVREQQPKTCNT